MQLPWPHDHRRHLPNSLSMPVHENWYMAPTRLPSRAGPPCHRSADCHCSVSLGQAGRRRRGEKKGACVLSTNGCRTPRATPRASLRRTRMSSAMGGSGVGRRPHRPRSWRRARVYSWTTTRLGLREPEPFCSRGRLARRGRSGPGATLASRAVHSPYDALLARRHQWQAQGRKRT